jgi:hypothetical protein
VVIMGLLGRIMGRGRSLDSTSAADREWSERVRGVAALQTPDEQLATRQGMEAELDAQRKRRSDDASPDIATVR